MTAEPTASDREKAREWACSYVDQCAAMRRVHRLDEEQHSFACDELSHFLAPLIAAVRAETVAQCAKIADGYDSEFIGHSRKIAAADIAKLIRSLANPGDTNV